MGNKRWHGWVVAGLIGACVGAAGCWRTTQVLTTAHAAPGEVGYGASVHSFHIYLVVAYAGGHVIGTSTVNFSPADIPGLDSFWQVHKGGRAIRYCQMQGAVPVCNVAERGGGFFSGAGILVDPLNLGSTTVVTEGTAGGQQWWSASGTLQRTDFENLHTPVTPMRGIWVRRETGEILYCAETQGRGQCDNVVVNGKHANGVVLGTRVLMRPEPTDVLWLAANMGIGPVYRCAATAAQPVPVCEVAREVGPVPSNTASAVPFAVQGEGGP
jgi:hypothetical protein